MRASRLSLIIPAYNESALIQECLDSVMNDCHALDAEVVVVVNGTSDMTADVARKHPIGATVFDLSEGNKIAAINFGGSRVASFPRVVLDADCTIGPGVLLRIEAALTSGGFDAAGVPIVYNLSGCSVMSRLFHETMAKLSVFDRGYLGSGIYALSRGGWDLVAPLPPVVADDEYVRSRLDADRITVVAGSLHVRPARDLRNLATRLRRVRSGNVQLGTLGVRDGSVSTRRTIRDLALLARDPRNVAGVTVFVGVTSVVRVLAKYDNWRRSEIAWRRDVSSR